MYSKLALHSQRLAYVCFCVLQWKERTTILLSEAVFYSFVAYHQYLFLQPSFCKIRIYLFLFSPFHRWKDCIPCILLSTWPSTPKPMGNCSLSGHEAFGHSFSYLCIFHYMHEPRFIQPVLSWLDMGIYTLSQSQNEQLINTWITLYCHISS